MIALESHGDKFVVSLDKNHEYYTRAYIAMRSLLTVQELPNDKWAMGYDDLVSFKSKLDSLGLVDGRTMNESALQLASQYQALQKRNEDIKNGVHNEYIESLIKGKLKTTPYKDQVTGISYLVNNRRAGMFSSMGIGKAQPLDAKILTPTGWKLMGQMKVKDRVINSKGKISRVTGVFPQGIKAIYRVTFTDGSSTECCEDHLWKVQTPRERASGYPSRIIPLKDFKDDLVYGSGNRKRFIPIVNPVDFVEKQKLPLHPYVLGCLLGDGGLSTESRVGFTSIDREIIDAINSFLPDNHSLKFRKGTECDYAITRDDVRKKGGNFVLSALRLLSLHGVKSDTKFIPDMYKFSSVSSRMSLLQGLLDTDGSVSVNSCIEYTSVSERLADGVSFLVRSLGGKATKNSRIPTFTYKGIKKKRAYRIHISMAGYFPPFKLSRKAEAWSPRTKYPPARAFKSVEFVGRKEAQCISVDAKDHLYVTDDFILTHNTIQALGSVVSLSDEVKKTLVIAPKSVLSGFANEIEKHTYLSSITIPPGRKPSLKFLQDNKHGNWDMLLVHPENLIGSSKRETYGDITKLLKTMRFDMVIVDEFHQYKNLSAKRTKCVLSLLAELRDNKKQLPRAVLMTGTPVSESPLNAYTVLHILSTDVLPHVDRFENYFTIKDSFDIRQKNKRTGRFQTITVQKVKGYKNLGELKQRLERVSIRRTKDDMEGFPDQVFTTRSVELKGNQKALYKTVCGEVVESLSQSSKINLTNFFSSASAVRLRQLLNHPQFLDEKGTSAKYDEIDIILEELFSDPEQKVVLWTEYRKAVDLIYDRWNEKYGVVKLYGGVDITNELANSFESDGGPRIAASIAAKVGTGVDFLARARTAIYIDRPYSFTQYKQSIDRIHRRVKTTGELSKLDRIRSQPATIIYLDVPDSIDELVKVKLYGKQEVADALTIEDSKLVTMGKSALLRYLR